MVGVLEKKLEQFRNKYKIKMIRNEVITIGNIIKPSKFVVLEDDKGNVFSGILEWKR
jgi:hypothetical protein